MEIDTKLSRISEMPIIMPAAAGAYANTLGAVSTRRKLAARTSRRHDLDCIYAFSLLDRLSRTRVVSGCRAHLLSACRCYVLTLRQK